MPKAFAELHLPSQVRRVALGHYVAAAAWAARIRDAALVRVAARHVASGGRPVEHAHGRRMLLLSPYRTVLKSMAEIGDVTREGMALRSELYRVVLQCLADDSQWDTGLTVAEEAFSALSPQYTGLLWSSRLMFQSKLGQDVTLSLAAMRQVSCFTRAVSTTAHASSYSSCFADIIPRASSPVVARRGPHFFTPSRSIERIPAGHRVPGGHVQPVLCARGLRRVAHRSPLSC